MSNTNPHKFAKEYDKMMEEYLILRERATDMIVGDHFDENLLDRIEKLQDDMIKFNKKFIYNIHYVIPHAEFTKH
ncbi:MAG: hypothetical protein ACR2PH_02555 [Desulfobulbia bacterium]